MKKDLYSLDFETFPTELEGLTFPHGDFSFAKKMKKSKFEKRL